MRPLASPPLIAGEVVEADAIQEVVNESAGGGAGDASVELGGHANADADADADADAQPVEMVFNTWASLKQWLTALVTQPQLKTSKLVTLFLVGALSMEISSYTERLEKDISVQKYCRSLKDALQDVTDAREAVFDAWWHPKLAPGEISHPTCTEPMAWKAYTQAVG
eukprot:3543091-Rhodomonas_salina.1